MSKKFSLSIEKWPQSNYQIIISVTPEQLSQYKASALTEFAKTYKKDGFRPGKVPLDIVKKEVNEIYLEMDAMNELINNSIDTLINDHKDIKFIGQPYDLDKKTEGENSIFTYKLDVYPEVEILNDNRKSVTIPKINDTISDTELDEAIKGLRHQYATYIDSDSVTHHTVDRLKVIYMNADSEEIFSKTIFIEHDDKHDGGFHNLEGKVVWDVIQLPYADNVPHKLQYTKEDHTPTTITIEILRTQKEELPEFTEEKIQELFGNEGIKTLDELKTKVAELIKDQKYSNSLVSSIDEFVKSIAGSFDVQIPRVMIDSEYENRYKSMTERFGGKEKFESAYLQLPNWKDELTKRQNELQSISKNSLTKFFVLQKVSELLGVADIARDKDMDVEEKLYAHFNK